MTYGVQTWVTVSPAFLGNQMRRRRMEGRAAAAAAAVPAAVGSAVGTAAAVV